MNFTFKSAPCGNGILLEEYVGTKRTASRWLSIEEYESLRQALNTSISITETNAENATPKFKVGDWLWHKEKGVFPVLIAGYDEEQGYLAKYVGSETYFGREAIENEYRLWSIADAKDGDVLCTRVNGCPFIYDKGRYNNDLCYYYAGVDVNGNFVMKERKTMLYHFGPCTNVVPATEEQRKLLFGKMEESGYEWDAEKKELKKLNQHYDISNFHAGMPVLVRVDDKSEWDYDTFSRYRPSVKAFACSGGRCFFQCIPYEMNSNLLGTTDMPSREFINW